MRDRQVLNAAISFALVVLLMFSFTFDPNTNVEVRSLSGGLLWVVYLFAGVLVLNRSFARETTNDSLEALVAAPLSGESLFLGKTLASFVLILVVELISLPVFGIFYDISWLPRFGQLLPVFALGGWSFAAVGTTFGAVTARNRMRELMLPLAAVPSLPPGAGGVHEPDVGRVRSDGGCGDRAVAAAAGRFRRDLYPAGHAGDGTDPDLRADKAPACGSVTPQTG